jgi:hypothetical protein
VDGEQPREERAKEENTYKETKEPKIKSQRGVSQKHKVPFEGDFQKF